MTLENIRQRVKGKQVYIYGAQTTSYDICLALQSMGINAASYVVTNTAGNPEKINTVPVISVNELKTNDDIFFFIAVPEYLHPEIVNILEVRGFKDYICIESNLEFELLRYFHSKNNEIKFAEDFAEDRDFIHDNDSVNDLLEVYVANSYFDKPLRTKVDFPSYCHWVQAGATLDPEIGTEFLDNTCINISGANRNYDELTVTYWSWKNRHPAFKGIAHYRRYFDLTDIEFELLMNNKIDAILPIPFLGWPTAEMQFGRYNEKIAVKTMLEVIGELYPSEIDRAKEILYGKYVYNYNMLIARAEVFDAYCAWMFPVLFEAEKRLPELIASKGHHPRVCGHLGELLTSLYFQLHKDELRIIHGRKIWLS